MCFRRKNSPTGTKVLVPDPQAGPFQRVRFQTREGKALPLFFQYTAPNKCGISGVVVPQPLWRKRCRLRPPLQLEPLSREQLALGDGVQMPVSCEGLQKHVQGIIQTLKPHMHWMHWHKVASDAVTLLETALALNIFHTRGEEGQKAMCAAIVMTACAHNSSREESADLEDHCCVSVRIPKSKAVLESMRLLNRLQGRGPAALRRLLGHRPALQDVIGLDLSEEGVEGQKNHILFMKD